ncbi:MAG: hypothetical protein V4857_10595 [Pseudomonadota bacterium]
MRNLLAGLFFALICLHANASEFLAIEEAVKIAEKFVAENGYTNLPEASLKRALDGESIEWTSDRQRLVARRLNTLLPGAIGAKSGRRNASAGWSVAFDFASKLGDPNTCRVVTMASNGTDIRVEHVDGIRKYFIGFKNP